MTTKITVSIFLMSLIISSTALFNTFSLQPVNAQRVCDNQITQSAGNALPVILLHGYKEPAGVWELWEHKLAEDNIPFCTVTFDFSDDSCGSATAHASELGAIIEEVKGATSSDQVNIVAHSKGGLDARDYLSSTDSSDVANLIMIGTPNGGGPIADFIISINIFNPALYYPSHILCTPALHDLETNADVLDVAQNPHTNYYTIYGNWEPGLPCREKGSEDDGYDYLARNGHIPNDGIVPVWSSEALGDHVNLGSTTHYHTELLNNDEYNLSQSVLLP